MKLLYKDAILKIKNSYGRFLSVLLIVALGVGFFAGLREASPDMLATIDTYYDNQNLMDFKIVSTAGLTDDDVDALSKLSLVEDVVPSYSMDRLERGKSVRVHALETKVNQSLLIDGRMPKKVGECIADAKIYQVGDVITFEDENDGLKENVYKVVGTVKSPLYMGVEKGISTVGSGKLNSFLFVLKEDFTLPYYTEIYLTSKESKKEDFYSQSYERVTEKLNRQLLEIKPIQETKRYEAMQEEITTQQNNLQFQLQKLVQKKGELQSFDQHDEAEMITRQMVALQSQMKEMDTMLETLPKPEWYLLDRTNQTGYTSLQEDIGKVDAIAQVFPVFFLLVAALMCLNTMTRMIEEERTEIGILTSLGYRRKQIIHSYIFYVMLATLLGVTIGLVIGYTTIPHIVYGIYQTNYILPELTVHVKWIPFTIIVFVTIALMILVTILAVMKELSEKPAVLLRPKAPKKGKKVLLECIPFLWKRFSFSWKVTSRNIFRYKKRVFMTIIGIMGCTALLLTGFGLRDDINRLGKLQYETLIHYDSIVGLKEETDAISEQLKKTLKDEKVSLSIPIYQKTVKFYANGENHDLYMMAISDTTKFKEMVTLWEVGTKKEIRMNDQGVVITKKMAELLHVKKDDTVKVRNGENELFVVTVSDVVENYTMHYMYMTDTYYQKVFQKKMPYNAVVLKGIPKDEDELATKLIDTKEISGISLTSDNIRILDEMVKGLNQIIYFIIVAASMLAFIVLYNLTTINIMERLREIATLKVLGFYDKEVSSYIYRETFLLTLIGSLVGLVAGIGLHYYVMTVAEMETITFLKQIELWSFVFALLLTLIFSLVIQLFTYFKLKKVDMISSLKSVE